MNTETATTLACPSCTSTHGVAMTDGTRLCLDCRHEWNPATVPRSATVAAPGSPTVEAAPSAVAPVVAPAAAEGAPLTPDDVLGPPDDEVAALAAVAALEALIGTEVVLEGGQRATLVYFPDDDHAEVRLSGPGAGGEVVTVEWSDVERALDAPPPVADVPEATALALARVNAAVAGLALRAGLASIAGAGQHAEIITPPTGWLPDDVDTLPVVEQGSAYAVAMLVHAFGLDRDIVGAIADHLLAESQDTDTTKGGTE